MYFDESRSSWIDEGSRPLSTVIWYPATNGASQEEWEIDIHQGNNLPYPL